METGKCSRKAKPAMRMIMKMTLLLWLAINKGRGRGGGKERMKRWLIGNQAPGKEILCHHRPLCGLICPFLVPFP